MNIVVCNQGTCRKLKVMYYFVFLESRQVGLMEVIVKQKTVIIIEPKRRNKETFDRTGSIEY